MKRTVTVNLSGTAFIIDEDAYRLLDSYLTDITRRLAGKEENNEVIGDIEYRISEIFREKGADQVRVVDISLVRYVISTIGNPQVFGDAETPGTYTELPALPQQKKLRRDPYDKVLGGVCSGLAVFFNADVALVRVIAVLLVLFGGLSVWVYIVLWIVIPKASTPQELAMFDSSKGKG